MLYINICRTVHVSQEKYTDNFLSFFLASVSIMVIHFKITEISSWGISNKIKQKSHKTSPNTAPPFPSLPKQIRTTPQMPLQPPYALPLLRFQPLIPLPLINRPHSPFHLVAASLEIRACESDDVIDVVG